MSKRWVQTAYAPAAMSIALSLALLASGCLLDTRDVESGGGEVCFRSTLPRNFNLVFTNLDGALDCLQPSTYEDQLDPENFRFIPSASTAASFPDIFPNPEESWGFEQERAWLNVLFSGTDSLEASIRLEDLKDPSGDSTNGPLQVEATYSVRHVPNGGTAIVYRGEAIYTLEVVATNWVLVEWREKESAVGQTPFGNLRGGFQP